MSQGPSTNRSLPGKPEIEFPGDEPPRELMVDDIIQGDGDLVGPGNQISAHYVGVAFTSGEEFDASWNRGQPLTFQLGAGQVIAGWDQGITGMRVGGRRQITIPPHLAYGDQGAPPAIGPGETLIFVVDLLDAR